MVAINNFQIVILALAVVFSSWSAYLNAGIVLAKEPFIRKLNFTGIMFIFQFMLAGVGIWVGFKVSSFEVWANMLISLSILLIFGLKVLLTGIRSQGEEKAFDFTDNKVTMFAALAEGITPLAIGIAIGLLSAHPYSHWIVLGFFLLTGIVSALVLSARLGIVSLKFRFGPIGGLLLLAAAIKLAINLTGF